MNTYFDNGPYVQSLLQKKGAGTPYGVLFLLSAVVVFSATAAIYYRQKMKAAEWENEELKNKQL